LYGVVVNACVNWIACVVFRLATLLRYGCAGESMTGFFLSCTASMEQIASGTEAAAVDHDFSSPAENIFVPVGIQTDDCFL